MASVPLQPIVMDADHARAVARRVHAIDHDRDGAPLLRHITRVAISTPPEARVVAWLHEALESPAVTEHELLDYGLDEDELRALRLLARPTHTRSPRVYLAHVEMIARAAGRSGRLARIVKIADLEDRRRHHQVHADGWSPPYEIALRRLGVAPGSYAHA